MTTATPPTNRTGTRWKWLFYAASAATLSIAARYFHVQDRLREALDWIGDFGLWGAALFVVIYALAAVLLVPGSVLALGAGAVFGLIRGTIVVSIASTLGATCAFLVGRYLAREAVARKIASNPKFSAIDRAVADEGWKIVLLTRLSPVFPYTLLNYAFGLTPVKVGHYVLASWIGMMPGTVMYVYLGTLAQAGLGERARSPGEWVLYAVGLLATVAVTLFVTRLARRALSGRIAG